jgi:hypothetical protein
LLTVDQISPNPENPRQVIDEHALSELVASIRRWGQLQPVVVRRHGEGYQLICGERRWRAHLRAGIDTIWAVERDATDHDVLALALVENLHRAELSVAEKVAALDQLAELVQVTGLRRTAAYLHMDPGWLSRQLAVRRDPVIFPSLEAGQVGFGQATELLRATTSTRAALLQRVLDSPNPIATATIRSWVEDARAAERQSSERAPDHSSAPDAQATASPYRALLDQLEALGAPASADDCVAMRDLINRACQLLASVEPTDEQAAPSTNGARSTSVDLTCLLCGELAGLVENGRSLRARTPGSMRRDGARLACGRCGGPLTSGERTVSYSY